MDMKVLWLTVSNPAERSRRMKTEGRFSSMYPLSDSQKGFLYFRVKARLVWILKVVLREVIAYCVFKDFQGMSSRNESFECCCYVTRGYGAIYDRGDKGSQRPNPLHFLLCVWQSSCCLIERGSREEGEGRRTGACSVGHQEQ